MIEKLIVTITFFVLSSFLWGQDGQQTPAPEKTTESALEKEVTVVLGIDHVEKFDFAPHTKVEVGNDTVLSHQLLPQKREIVLKGIKPGQTSVRLRNTVGDTKVVYLVKVVSTANSKMVQELKDLLGDIEGLEIGVKGDKVYVGGKIVVPSDIGRVVVILGDLNYKDVLRLVELSAHTKGIIARKMQAEIQGNGMKNVTVRVVNKLFWLEGVVEEEGKKQLAEKIALAYLPDDIQSLAQQTDSVQTVAKSIIQNFISVNAQAKPEPAPKLIKITAQFVELTKDYSKVFGFKWTPLLAGDGGSIGIGRSGSGGVTTQSDGTLAATISNLFPKLASAKSAGHARVIQSGVIIIKDEANGTITKSTETPYSIGSGEFTKADKATAGFSLGITPKVLQEEKIDLNMNIKVSSSIGSPPEVLSNEIKTNIIVKSKDSAVVGGVVINKTSTDFDKDPPYGEDSYDGGTPLFSFLRSKSHTTQRSQFVVFITPEIIESAASGTEEITRKFRARGR